jgi:hypothetical protein
LLTEWWLQRRDTATEASAAAAAWLTAPILTFIGMQLYFGARFGRVTLLEAQASFGRAPSWPWTPIWRDLLEIAHRGFTLFAVVTMLNVAASCFVFLFAWRFRARLAVPDSVLMCGVMLMQLCYGRIWAPFTVSSLRYVLSTPGFVQGSALLVPATPRRLARLVLAVGGVLLSGGVAFLFGMKAFVS